MSAIERLDEHRPELRSRLEAFQAQLDALPPTELRRRIREAIESLIDDEAWNRAMLVEAAQQETCRNYAAAIQRLMSANEMR